MPRPGPARRRLTAALGCAVGFAVVGALALHGGRIRRADAELALRAEAHDAGLVGGVADAFAWLGDPLPQLVFAAALLTYSARRREPRVTAAAVGVLGAANLSTLALKHLLAQSRWVPSIGFYAIGPVSFPSGHTTAMAAMTFAVFFVAPERRRRPAAACGAVLTTLVGVSMVINGSHLPSDIVGGALVASSWGFVGAAALSGADR